jgi:hypothetical protein
MKTIKKILLAVLLCVFAGCAEDAEITTVTSMTTTTATSETAATTASTTAAAVSVMDSSDYFYMAAMNSKHGGYVNFDENNVYYVEFKDRSGGFDENNLVKRSTADGTETIIVEEDDEQFYQKIHAINIWNGRVYFLAIPTQQDYQDGRDGFMGFLLSADANGGDIRLEHRDYFGYVYMMDNGSVIYSIATEMETPNEWHRYNFEIKGQTGENDPFNLPAPQFGCIADYRYHDYVIYSDYSSFSKNLYVYNTVTEELTEVEEISADDDRYVNNSTVYNDMLYYYITEGVVEQKQTWQKRTLMEYDFETKTSKALFTTDSLHDADSDNESYKWEQLFLYTTPFGLYEYNSELELIKVEL